MENKNKIIKMKERLQIIRNKCSKLSEQHRKEINKFHELFEEIYGIDFNEEFDSLTESVNYGMSDFSLKEIEEEIIRMSESCNYSIDKNKLRNIGVFD